MEEAAIPATKVSFVSRGVLESSDGGNTFAEKPAEEGAVPAEEEEDEDEMHQSLFEQLSQTLKKKHENRIEGTPEEFCLEDQEFVKRHVKRGDEQLSSSIKLGAQEFHRQKMLMLARETRHHPVADVKKPRVAEEEEMPVTTTIVKKKKKKLIPAEL
jgi:hypothetical protein